MVMTEQRAAIYGGNSHYLGVEDESRLERALEVCCRYCAERGYQLSEQHIYQGGQEPLWSDAPQLVRLRTAALQRRFDVLVIPSLASLGLLPPWRSWQSTRVIDGLCACQVRVESVMERHGVHDVSQQMLLEALHFARHIGQTAMRRQTRLQHNTLRQHERQG